MVLSKDHATVQLQESRQIVEAFSVAFSADFMPVRTNKSLFSLDLFDYETLPFFCKDTLSCDLYRIQQFSLELVGA